MVKSGAVIKVDTPENWAKAVNYVPDCFTILVYDYGNRPPKIKIGDGKRRVSELPFLNSSEVVGDTLEL